MLSGANGRRLTRAALILGAGLATWIATGPLALTGEYVSFIIAATCYFAIVTMSVSMLAGFCGIWPIGHTAFTAIGAYFAANLAKAGLPIEVILPAGMLAAAALGYILGTTAGRFSILYFGLLTLAISLTAFEIIGHWDRFTGGENGIQVPAIRSLVMGRTLGIRDATGFCLFSATLALLLIDWVCQGPPGRRWLAVKSQRIASMAVGFVPPRENALAFAFSAAMAAISGIAMAVAIGYLDPESFSLNAGVTMLVSTVVGGAGSIVGAVFGSAFITAVPEIARGYPNVKPFIFGAATVAVLLFLRKGVVPTLIEMAQSWIGRAKTLVAPTAGESRDLAGLVNDILPAKGKALTVEKVFVNFGGVKALQDVSLVAPAGEITGLIGPNGSGKTTLINVMSGFVLPASAAGARLGDVDLLPLKPWERINAGFGRTFQHAELFAELTIRDMLTTVARQGVNARRAAGKALVAPEAVAERIIEGLGLAHVADSLPQSLPFGIQKAADIARALAGGAGMLALDEPFSGLDSDESTKLRTMLRELRAAGVTILIIDHAVHEIFDLAREVVVLDFGCVIARGAPAEIRSDRKVQEAYFGLSEDSAEARHG
jgi:ABC-type branched-subunit amino acid transport system ATPase component/ABC-type branched-subunit amino acid transport system permease subunit